MNSSYYQIGHWWTYEKPYIREKSFQNFLKCDKNIDITEWLFFTVCSQIQVMEYL